MRLLSCRCKNAGAKHTGLQLHQIWALFGEDKDGFLYCNRVDKDYKILCENYAHRVAFDPAAVIAAEMSGGEPYRTSWHDVNIRIRCDLPSQPLPAPLHHPNATLFAGLVVKVAVDKAPKGSESKHAAQVLLYKLQQIFEKFDKDAGLSILAILLHNQLCHAPLCFARCNKPTDVMDWVPCIIRDASDGFLNHDEANAFMQALHAPVCYANIDVSTMDTRTSE